MVAHVLDDFWPGILHTSDLCTLSYCQKTLCHQPRIRHLSLSLAAHDMR